MKEKNKTITLRVEQNLYDFLKEFAFQHNQTVSEMIRTILKYFYMRLLIGDFTDKDYKSVKKEFLKKFEKLPKTYSQEIWKKIFKNKNLILKKHTRKL